MTEQEKNIRIVKDAFEAMSKGDLQFLLNQVADDIDWQSPVTGTVTEPISWARPRHGKEELKAFFKEVFEKIRPIEMKPLTLSAQDDRIYVEGTTRGIVNATGREYSNTWVMAITVRSGKITTFRHYYDTVDVSKAFKADVRKVG